MALAPILPTALSIGLLLGAVPAAAGSPSRYQEYDQGAYLSYVNAPGPSADIIASPLLRVSFGGRSYAAVMDTGSTGVVVSADKIPNIDRLPSLGPGELTYSSSGRIMIGRWVATPMTIAGGDGTRVGTAPIAVPRRHPRRMHAARETVHAQPGAAWDFDAGGRIRPPP